MFSARFVRDVKTLRYAGKMADLELLRGQWKILYSKTLPQLAKQDDPAQSKWPVTLDHCFARIILDNTVGQGTQQWDQVIKKPAVKNMTAAQLEDAIELGKKIQHGKLDLQELDQISLMCRGKNEGKYGSAKAEEGSEKEGKSAKRKAVAGQGASSRKRQKKEEGKQQSILNFAPSTEKNEQLPTPPLSDLAPPKTSSASSADFEATLKQIRSSSITPYRKRLYIVLLSVPRGRYTTYAAMSDYLKSSARAVGNGMRNNPFAPNVPCHRVLAADGSIGGFQGDWGREGKYANKKLELLRSEGVRFDGRGKVVGEPFRKFHEFEGM